MVVSVAAYPWEKWFWIYDSANDKYEQKNCNITVREWEMEKVDDYFENIFKAIKKPIDEFYFIIYWDYYNEIRKKFVELSKKHGIKIFRIMNEYELHATVALKYVKTDSDSLWIFRYFFHVISCEIWKKNNNQQFTISEFLFQRRTNCELNFVETDLQNLRTKIRSTSTSPTIVVFQTIPKYIFERIFNIHSRINFFGHVSSLYILLQIIQKQKTNKIIDKIQPMFGRIIDIKIDGIFIESFLQNCNVLLQTRYKINVKDKKLSLKGCVAMYEEKLPDFSQ